MAAVQLINVNGTDVAVMSYDFSKKEQDLDSGRNLEGIMDRNILAHHPRTIDIVLPPLDREGMHNYLKIFDNPYLTVRAFDIFTNQIETLTMMHGDLNPSLYWNPEEFLYNAMKIQLVEY
jgi:hypothetical protein